MGESKFGNGVRIAGYEDYSTSFPLIFRDGNMSNILNFCSSIVRYLI